MVKVVSVTIFTSKINSAIDAQKISLATYVEQIQTTHSTKKKILERTILRENESIKKQYSIIAVFEFMKVQHAVTQTGVG